MEGQPSTEFPLQSVSVPSNVNSYLLDVLLREAGCAHGVDGFEHEPEGFALAGHDVFGVRGDPDVGLRRSATRAGISETGSLPQSFHQGRAGGGSGGRKL